MTSIIFFFIFIPILSIILLSVNFIFAPHKPYKEKKTPFECGYHSFLSQNRTQFTISFFIFALLFLIFDLEIVLIYPYSVSSYANNIYGLIVMIIFTLILTVGFIFELGKNALKIESKQNIAYNDKLNADKNYSKLKPLKSSIIFFNVLNLFKSKKLNNILLSVIVILLCGLFLRSLIIYGLNSLQVPYHINIYIALTAIYLKIVYNNINNINVNCSKFYYIKIFLFSLAISYLFYLLNYNLDFYFLHGFELSIKSCLLAYINRVIYLFKLVLNNQNYAYIGLNNNPSLPKKSLVPNSFWWTIATLNKVAIASL